MITSLFAMTVYYDTCITAETSPPVDLMFNLPFAVQCSKRFPLEVFWVRPSRKRPWDSPDHSDGITYPIDNKTEIAALPLGQFSPVL